MMCWISIDLIIYLNSNKLKELDRAQQAHITNSRLLGLGIIPYSAHKLAHTWLCCSAIENGVAQK